MCFFYLDIRRFFNLEDEQQSKSIPPIQRRLFPNDRWRVVHDQSQIVIEEQSFRPYSKGLRNN